MTDVKPCPKADAAVLANQICGCATHQQRASDIAAILEFLAKHRTPTTREAAMREALDGVVAATRAYLPPDGIGAQECLNRILAATDNPAINRYILDGGDK